MILDESRTQGPVYSLVKKVLATSGFPGRRSYYELARWDGVSERTNWETVAQGEGLRARLRIVTYLRGLAEIDGGAAPAALTALKAGWSVIQVSKAPTQGPGST